MSELLFNDLVLIVNRKLIRNLAISRDHQFENSVEGNVALLDGLASLLPPLAKLLDEGVEHPVEVMANLQMLVPRLLYATTNPAFGVIPGSTDLDKLLNRLRRYDAIAAGPVVDTLPKDAEIAGTPLDNPCPITFKADPNNRFTFLRDDFFTNSSNTFVEVTANGLVFTITGHAYRGDLFSRRHAMHSSTHQFEMKLLYKVDFLNNSDINLGPVPFKMVANPPAPVVANNPSLPAKDEFIFATRFGPDEDRSYALPALIPDPDNPGQFLPPGNLLGRFYTGQLDDQIYETSDGDPIYRVEPRSDTEPERFVIRKIGDPTILAEAQGGRMLLKFDKIQSLTFTPDNVSAGEKSAISNSLVKIQPTLAQMFTCSDIQGNTQLPLSMLSLLGPTSLDIPIMPRVVAVPVDAEVIDQQNAPQPFNSVHSNITSCDLDAVKFFTNADLAAQAFGVSGKIGAPNGDQNFTDFSGGADFAVGISQSFMQPMLDLAGEGILDGIKQDPPEGLQTNTLQFSAVIGSGALLVHVTGQGSVSTPWPLPDIDYDFTCDVRLHFRAQKSLVVDGDGNPRDRFNCPVPEEVLTSLGLNIANNVIELAADKADRNPLGFLGYNDPGQGIAPFDFLPPITRIPPPVLDKDGNEIIVDDPDNPPNVCMDPDPKKNNQRNDNANALGQATFDDTLNPSVRHEWSLVAVPPGEDDVDVDVDVSFFALLLTAFVGIIFSGLLSFLAPLLGPLGVVLVPIVQIALLTGIFLLPFTNLIVSAIATSEVRKKLAEQNLPSFNPDLNFTSFLSIHLEDPAVVDPFALQSILPGPLPGAFITRYHVVIQAAGPNEGG